MTQWFNLSLDTTAPQNTSISHSATYANAAVTASLNAGTSGDVKFMKVWVDLNSEGTAAVANNTSWEVYAATKSLTPSNEGTNYFHAMFMDEVGNQTDIQDSNSFIFDTTGPTVSNVACSARVNTEYVNVNVSFSDLKTGIDAVSGVSSINIVGTDTHVASQTFTLTDTDRTNGYIVCNVALTISSAEKEAKAPVTCAFGVKATDRAGNTGSTSSGHSVIYDAFPASATLTLMDKTCTSALPAYVNAYDYGAQLTSSDTDIAYYKCWEGSTEPTDWTAWTGSPVNIKNQTFSTGEGLKTIHAKIKDTTGNETTLTDATATVDTTAPEVTLTVTPTVGEAAIVSNDSAHNTLTFTYAATDTHNMTNYELYVDNVKIKDGTFTTGMTQNVSTSEILSKSANEGTKIFVLKVEDVAGNWGSSSNVSTSVDLSAPVDVSVTADTYYTTNQATLTLAATDTPAGVKKMKCWVTGNEPDAWEEWSTTKTFTLDDNAKGASYTAHLLVKDAVENATTTAATTTFIVDTKAPTAVPEVDNVNVSDNKAYTNVQNHTVTLNAADATTNVAKMKIWGDLSTGNTSGDWETYAATKSITLSNNEGTKELWFKFQDDAGNTTDNIAYRYTLILDDVKPTPGITLYNKANNESLPARVNVRDFTARIEAADTYETAGLVYKLSGDLDQPSSDWTTYTEDSGKTYMSVSNLTLTTGDALKTITVTFKDLAGNEESASATVTLDQSAPVMDVNAPDYNVISNVHTKRLNDSAVAVDAYNDEVNFVWSCSENLSEWKVCVNDEEQTAAGALAIGTTAGSTNMSGINYVANTNISSKIVGADFKSTAVVSSVGDAAYEVIVYGLDEAGTWSAVHNWTRPV